MSLEEKILQIRNSGPVTRTQIADLLSFVGKPGAKQAEKVEAVKELNLENSQGYKVEDNLEEYKEF